jgi:uncharacterized membrane protein
MKYLRIAAIILFGFTVVKLFVHDLRAVSTIGKAIVPGTLYWQLLSCTRNTLKPLLRKGTKNDRLLIVN